MSDYIMQPGARLDIGPGGRPYETLGADEGGKRAAATAELRKMKSTLRSWLKFRLRNDARGSTRPTAAWAGEQALAADLYALLSQVHDAQQLPTPDVKANPNAAVALAEIALGQRPVGSQGPQATGILPLVIVGTIGAVVLFSVSSAIRNRAEVQKEEERLRCIREGDFWAKIACAQPSSLLLYGALSYGAYWAWTKGGLGKRVQRTLGSL